MAQTIKLKRSGTQNAVPSTSQLALGEVALNTYDGKMYIKKSVGGTESIVEIGGDATSSSGLDFTGNLNLADNVRIVIGDGNDLQIYHDGSNSYIDEGGTGDLRIRATNLSLRSKTTNERFLEGIEDGAVTIYHNNAAKLATTSAGIDVTGVITTDGMTTSADINFGDNDKAIFGTGGDLEIYHNGNNSFITDTGTGSLYVRASDALRIQTATNEEMLKAEADGAVTIYYNNAAKLATTSTGAQITGDISLSGNIVDSDQNEIIDIDINDIRFNGKHVQSAYGVWIRGENSSSNNRKAGIDGSSSGTTLQFYTQNAEHMRIDADGRLLVNTTSSIDNFAKIQVVGDSSSLARITLKDVDGTNQYTYFEQSGGGTRINTQNGTSNGFFTIGAWNGTASSDFLRVTADGRVGIGTTSPSRIFHVEDANVGIATSYGVAVIEAVDSQLDLISNSSGTWGSAINLVEGVGTSNTDVWSIARQTTGGSGNSSLRFNFGTTNQHTNPNKVTFTGDGKVGIGTDSPLATLDVRGDIELNSTYPVIRFKDSDSENDFSIIGGSGLFRIYDEDAAAARIAINSSGNVGIGTTSPSKPLHVVGAARVTGDFQVEGGDIEFNQSSGQARIRNLLQDTYMRFQVNVGGTQTNAINIRGNNAYVGIGSAEGGSSPVYPLDVYNAGADTVARFTSGDDRARIQISDDDTEVFVIAEGSKMSLGAANSLSSTNLTIDASGSLGIGTTSPGRKLHVSGSGATVAVKVEATDGVQSSLDLKNSEGEFRLINDGGALSIYDQTDTTERFKIDTSGNVGIGTTAPIAKLDVNGSINVKTGASIALAQDTYSDTAILIPRGTSIRSNTTGDYQRTLLSHLGTTGNGALQIGQQGTAIITDILMYPGSSGNIRFFPSGAEDIRFTDAGKVGIGTTSPGRKLTVQGATGDDLPARFIGGANTTHGSIEFQDPTTTADYKVTLGSKGDDLYFQAGGGEKARITSGGHLLVGKTSQDATNTVGAELKNTGELVVTTDGTAAAYFNRKTSDGTIAEFRKDNSAVGSIGSNLGRFYIHNNYGSGSGFRFDNAAIRPSDSSGASEDATTDLGASAARFKNLYLSGQVNAGTISSGAITATTLDTGQGANELYAMNQNVRTTDSPTFGGLTLNGGVDFNGSNINDINQINGSGGSGWLDFNMDTDSVYPQSTADNQTVLGSITHMNFVGDSNGNGTGGIFYWGYGVDSSDSGTFTQTMALDRSGNLTLTGALRGPATFTIDPAAHGDDTGTVVIAGNLQVDGTTTTINSTTLTVDDKNITLASGSTNKAAANGAGLTVDCGSDTDATFTYNGTSDQWELNKILKWDYALATTALHLNNNNIVGVNNISFADPGANEGLSWSGGNMALFESPNDLSNASGNLQVTYGGTRRFTVDNTGIDVNGTAEATTFRTSTGGIAIAGQEIYSNDDYTGNDGSIRLNRFGYQGGQTKFRDVVIYDGKGGQIMTVDGSAGRVGIGTTAPLYKLQVNGDSTSGVIAVKNAANGRDTFRSENAAGTRTFNIGNDASGHGNVIVRNSSGSITSYLAGSGASYFNGGNVGIGTTSPQSKIEVNLHSGVTSSLMNANTVNDVQLIRAGYSSSAATTSNAGAKWGLRFVGRNDSTYDTQKSGAIYAVSEDSGAGYNRNVGLAFHTSSFDAAHTERMRITNTGNLAIGQTAAPQKLTVAGNITVTGTTGIQIATLSRVSDAGRFELRDSGGNTKVQINASGNSYLNASSGRVGIGTTAPVSTLHVNGGGYFTGFVNPNGSGVGGLELGYDGTQSVLQSYHRGTSSYKAIHMNASHVAFNIGGVEKARVHTNGNVGIGTVSPVKNLHVNYSSSDTSVNTGNGLSGGTAGKGLLIQNADTTANTYANLDFRAGTADGRIAYKYTGTTNVGDFHFITDTTGNPETQLVIKNNGNVGIGTDSPDTTLDITSTGVQGLILNQDTGNSSASSRIFLKSAQRINTIVNVSGNTEFRTGASIGSTSGVVRFMINGSTGATTFNSAFTFPTSDGSGNQVLRTDGSGNVSWATVQGVGAPTYMQDADGDTKIQVEEGTDDDTIRFDTAGTQRMLITSSGNVGINSASPAKTLTVGGTFQSTGEAFFSHFDNITSSSRMRDDLRLNFGTARTFAITGNSSNMHMKNGTTNVMTFDTSNRVGIGTTAPTSQLHLHKDAGTAYLKQTNTANGQTLEIGNAYSLYTGANGAHSAIASDQVLAFATADAERMRIDSSGNVGIGTTNPTNKLHLSGDNVNLALDGTGAAGTPITSISLSRGAVNWGIHSGIGGANLFGIKDNQNSAYRLAIDSSGRVGIGTTSPASNLHVKTSVDNSVAQGLIIERSANSDKGYINYNGGGFQFRSTVGDPIVFGETDAEHMRILPDGNVGIGTSTPAFAFHVYTPSTNVVSRFESGDSQVWIDLHDSNSGTYGALLGHDGNAGQLFMVADQGVNRRFIIDTAGQVSIGTNVNPVARLQVEVLGIDTTSTSTTATTQVAIDTMAAATFRSAKYTIQVTNSTDSTYHLTEILLIHDGTTPGITEYGTVFTGSAAEATFDADISSGNVRLLATPASTDSMTFKVVRHCITV